MDNQDARVREASPTTGSPSRCRSKVLENPQWLAERRAKVKSEIEAARAARKAAADALKARRREVALSNADKLRAEKAALPPTSEQLAKAEREGERKRARRLLTQRRYNRNHRKKVKASPEYKRKKKAAIERRYRRRLKKRRAHARWLAKMAGAAAKREALAERRARREAIAAERERVRLAQGLPEKKSKRTKDLELEYSRGFRDGFSECLRTIQAGPERQSASSQSANTI